MNPQNDFSQNHNMPYGPQMQAQQMPQQMQDGPVPMNVINAVNANGIVTGDKVVNYIWKQIGICAMIIAGACLVGVTACILIMSSVSQEKNKMALDKERAEKDLAALYDSMAVKDYAGAIERINNVEILNGGDIKEINALLLEQFGSNYVLDIEDQNVNFVQKSGIYKYVSLGIRRDSGSVRVILYERIAGGEWILSSFDSTDTEDACRNSSKEERKALSGLDVCTAKEN